MEESKQNNEQHVCIPCVIHSYSPLSPIPTNPTNSANPSLHHLSNLKLLALAPWCAFVRLLKELQRTMLSLVYVFLPFFGYSAEPVSRLHLSRTSLLQSSINLLLRHRRHVKTLRSSRKRQSLRCRSPQRRHKPFPILLWILIHLQRKNKNYILRSVALGRGHLRPVSRSQLL